MKPILACEAEVLLGLLPFATAIVEYPTIEICLRKLWVKPKRLGECLDGLIGHGTGSEQTGIVVMKIGIVGGKADGPQQRGGAELLAADYLALREVPHLDGALQDVGMLYQRQHRGRVGA